MLARIAWRLVTRSLTAGMKLKDAFFVAFPFVALVLSAVLALLPAGGAGTLSFIIYALALVGLIGAVIAAVHHAEVIAHWTGEPYGTLVVTTAVTVIEVSLILSMMLGGDQNPTLARDTVFAVIMIVCAGLVGLCMLMGGIRFREQEFGQQGTNAYMTVIVALGILTLVLPNYTRSAPGPVYSAVQLAFVSVVTVALYGVFLFIQTIRHREFFTGLPVAAGYRPSDDHVDPGVPATPARMAWTSLLLILALAGVILLAKKFSGLLATALASAGAPPAAAGVVLALLVLLPESGIALRAARNNELQRSINIALGSVVATIGLTIPAVAAINLAIGRPLVLGLTAADTVLLLLVFAVSILSFGTGRTNVLTGFVHLVIFAVFLFLAFVP